MMKHLDKFDRILYIVAGGLTLLVLFQVVANALTDPFDARRMELSDRLRQSEAKGNVDLRPVWRFDAWQESLNGKASLWQELVAPPPPPPPKPPAPEPCPPPCKGLEDVIASRHQIGGKVKIILPDNPRGQFMEVGDMLFGARLESFDREFVVFHVYCESQGKDLYCKLPRV